MPVQDAIFGPLDSAIHDTVNGYVDPVTKARGATALAPKVGMQPNTLSNKSNPACEHELKLGESIAIQNVAGNFTILHAYAAALSHCAIPLPANNALGDAALLDLYCELHAWLGDFAENMRESLADGQVSAAEVDRLRNALDNSIRAGLCVVQRMQALVV